MPNDPGFYLTVFTVGNNLFVAQHFANISDVAIKVVA